MYANTMSMRSQPMLKALLAMQRQRYVALGYPLRRFATVEAERSLADTKDVMPLSRISFNDTKSIFMKIPTSELIQSGVLLSSMRLRPIFQHASTLLELSQKVVGKSLTMFVVKHTLFKQFCGGETLEELLKTGSKLATRQLGSIVDYAAEAEDSGSSGPSTQWLDNNVPLTKEGIYNSAYIRDTQNTDFAFVAFKVTSLCPPKICRKITASMNLLHSVYAHAVGYIADASQVSIYSPKSHEVLIQKDLPVQQAMQLLQTLWPQLSHDEAQQYILEMQQLPGPQSNAISYFQWTTHFSPDKLATMTCPELHAYKSKLLKDAPELWIAQSDLPEWRAACERVEKCISYADEKQVRLLVDAEQTFFQTAIDHIAIKLMEKYCKLQPSQKPEEIPSIVYNTYQLYLKNSLGKLKHDIARAQLFGYKFAAKLVRGAYMTQEEKVATEKGYEQPVWDTIEQTHQSYASGTETLLSQLPQCEMLCGTHNEKSVREISHQLGKMTGDQPMLYPFTFSQLYGMCDYISLQVARCGARSYKYLPYGSIDLVVPYLVRRAEENSSLLGGARKEAKLIWKEVRRRALQSVGFI